MSLRFVCARAGVPVAVVAEDVRRVGLADEVGAQSCVDLLASFGAGADERHALWLEGDSVVIVGGPLRVVEVSNRALRPLPPLLAAHGAQLGIAGLLAQEDGFAWVISSLSMGEVR